MTYAYHFSCCNKLKCGLHTCIHNNTCTFLNNSAWIYGVVKHTSDNGFIGNYISCPLLDHLLQYAAILGRCNVLHLKGHQFKRCLQARMSSNFMHLVTIVFF